MSAFTASLACDTMVETEAAPRRVSARGHGHHLDRGDRMSSIPPRCVFAPTP
jgi:hypothetical protein